MSSQQQLPTQQPLPQQGDLSWRLSSHPLTLLTFLGFRAASIVVYLLGSFLSFVLTFILTTLLLAADFYYLKNIAGRRLVGLRWWNEVNIQTGDSKWVFESAEGRGLTTNKTDARFFWIAVYAQPAWWIAIAVWSVITLKITWLSIIVVALILTITNAVAFSRCDKFSQASNIAGNAFYGTGIARNVAGSMVSRFFSRS